jgi:hypothetical protein
VANPTRGITDYRPIDSLCVYYREETLMKKLFYSLCAINSMVFDYFAAAATQRAKILYKISPVVFVFIIS